MADLSEHTNKVVEVQSNPMGYLEEPLSPKMTAFLEIGTPAGWDDFLESEMLYDTLSGAIMDDVNYRNDLLDLV